MSLLVRTPETEGAVSGPLAGRRLSRIGHLVVVAIVLAVAALTWIPSGSVNWARWIVVTALLYMMGIYVVSRRVENRRQAKDRLMTAVITCAFGLVALPLVSVSWKVIGEGAGGLSWEYLTSDMRNVVGEGGGASHAILGTILITGATAVISIPVGIFTAIYLVEYGSGKLAKSITAMVDVMTGVPSIVAGLFAYGLFVAMYEPGTRSGIAGAVALSVLMVPVVVRSAEEMLRLVPDELREASYALGVPKWKTIVKVVIPTSIAGLLTGATLAVARVIGETAPLLVAAAITDSGNFNIFDGRMASLPVYAYYQFTQPGVPPEAGIQRAWTAALCLIILVAILFSVARLLATLLKPKGLR